MVSRIPARISPTCHLSHPDTCSSHIQLADGYSRIPPAVKRSRFTPVRPCDLTPAPCKYVPVAALLLWPTEQGCSRGRAVVVQATLSLYNGSAPLSVVSEALIPPHVGPTRCDMTLQLAAGDMVRRNVGRSCWPECLGTYHGPTPGECLLSC